VAGEAAATAGGEHDDDELVVNGLMMRSPGCSCFTCKQHKFAGYNRLSRAHGAGYVKRQGR
jgi:hypothetical protein